MAGNLSQDVASQLARFRLESFRPGQLEVIQAVLAGHDCLCIMPTGGGKSLCYQLPAVVRDGLTLVVSPLIALMKDQVDALQRLGLRAELINSTLSGAEQAERLQRMAAGQYQLVYLAPERFRSPLFLQAIRHVRVQLLAVDEAHCISEWGHDFRHDYVRLGQYRQRLGNPQTIALTATATADVRADVVCQLQLREPRIFVAGFARPNLHYEVQHVRGRGAKDEALVRLLRETPGAGIIYAATRKSCEQTAETVRQAGRRVAVYHAGMPPEERRQTQEDFMSGRAELVVATNAFGMGIDKPDVRLVLHYSVPGSLEAYYQEAGRAGRDGSPSRCVLLYSQSDRYVQEFFIDSAFPPRETIAQVYQYLREHPDDPVQLTQQELKEALDLSISAEGVGTCERLLEKSGVLQRLEPHRNMAAIRLEGDVPTLVDLLPAQAQVRRRVLQMLEKLVGDRRGELVYFRPEELADATELELATVQRALRELSRLAAVDYVPPFRGRAVHMVRRDLEFDQLELDFESLERRRALDYDKLERVLDYALAPGCRQQVILRYFGDPAAEDCGHCDRCDGRAHHDGGTHHDDGRGEFEPQLADTVIKVLSGVARARGRVGKQLVAGMLCGSGAVRVRQNGLQRLSTFGLLAHLTQTDVVQLIDGLLAAGLLEQHDVDRFRPVVALTESGASVMRGQSPLNCPLPIARSLRRKLRAGPPAGAVAAPAAAAADPATAATLRPGTAECLLARTPAADGEEASRGQPSAASGDGRGAGGSDEWAADEPGQAAQPSHYWTWRLLRDGYTAAQCSAIRGLPEEAILDHALRAAENGLPVPLTRLLSSSQLSALEQVVASHPPHRLHCLLAELPAGLRGEHLQLYLKCRPAARAMD